MITVFVLVYAPFFNANFGRNLAGLRWPRVPNCVACAGPDLAHPAKHPCSYRGCFLSFDLRLFSFSIALSARCMEMQISYVDFLVVAFFVALFLLQCRYFIERTENARSGSRSQRWGSALRLHPTKVTRPALDCVFRLWFADVNFAVL